jgi:hypothetical protein
MNKSNNVQGVTVSIVCTSATFTCFTRVTREIQKFKYWTSEWRETVTPTNSILEFSCVQSDTE